jgi:hypothetical protein
MLQNKIYPRYETTPQKWVDPNYSLKVLDFFFHFLTLLICIVINFRYTLLIYFSINLVLDYELYFLLFKLLYFDNFNIERYLCGLTPYLYYNCKVYALNYTIYDKEHHNY